VIFFVTPAFQRYELSAVCFEQRSLVVGQLAQQGIEARCVVIADDDNLDIARSMGFEVVERDNRWLGRKFNDGIEFALRQGADWIVPIGSDSWIDPGYFIPEPAHPITSRFYAAVEADRLLQLTIAAPGGVGPHVFARELFVTTRPAGDRLRRGIDTSILAAMGPIEWEWRDRHPMQYIGFRGERHITTYAKMQRAWGGLERLDSWEALADHYPLDLVNRARQVMKDVRRPLTIGRLDRWSVRDRLLGVRDRISR
jgi:glycosyltransferase involved in cell wall biosynthesis